MKKHKWTTEEVVDILLMATDEPIVESYIPDDVIFWIIVKLKDIDDYENILSYYEEEEMMKDREERGEQGIFG